MEPLCGTLWNLKFEQRNLYAEPRGTWFEVSGGCPKPPRSFIGRTPSLSSCWGKKTEQDTVGAHFFQCFQASKSQMLNYTSLCLLCIHLLQCISLCFVCCKGIKHITKQKMENPCQIPKYCKNLEKTKKQKRRTYVYPKPRKQKTKTKNKKGRTYVKPKNTKKNGCPSAWHGVSTFGFFGFSRENQKTQKNGRTYVLVSGMGSVLWFFWFFWFFEVFAIFWYLKWVLPFCFFGFSRFLQHLAFPKKTLVSFPKKPFFS